MGSESKPIRWKAKWAVDSEAMRARGIIIILVKSNKLAKKSIETKHLSLVKGRLSSFFAAKTLQTWAAVFAISGL